MRIGELAKRTGLSRDTIRFYERHGLIASLPSQSASNSYRDYPEALVEQLAMIVEAREAGLSVADLETLIAHLEGSGESGFDANLYLDDKIVEVRRTISQARKFLRFLEATRDALEAGPVEWRNQDD